ncbi:hypothetical protein [Pseudomonas phage PA26]|uniref:Uncharacterized protein n=1 Tax=Pseudomonas phage PA26 TaxID=1204542 RepID=I7D9L0_9CAUD|nr:hypothetical protein FDH24_gp07 [Pseudomonas phage PA26]AFO70506.1 hypothetical protein [Pseudomonas phage PA26]
MQDNRNFDLYGRMFKVGIVPTKGKLDGFRVQVTVFNKGYPNTVLTHTAMCGDEFTARTLMSSVKERRRLNLEHWNWHGVSNALPFACTSRFKTKPITLEI